MLLLGAVACKKTDNSASLTGNVSNSDAAEMAATSISLNSGGVAGVSDDATSDATHFITDLHLECGATKADSFSRANTVLPYVYSYKLKYSYTLNCNTAHQPYNITVSVVFGGFFSGPHLSTTSSGSTVFTIAGLTPTAPNFVIHGEYKRAGSFKSKVDTTNAGNSNVDIVLTSLTVTKPGRTIAGGSATITITGEVPKKGSFSYTGTLKFNGDGTATLTLNGVIYTINLATGVKTKV